MKSTLLAIVQKILTSMDADEVNSITDTVESQSVATIVQDCYYEMLSNRNWPHTQRLVQIEPSNDLNRPTYLKLPDNIKELTFIKYDCRKEVGDSSLYRDICYKYPDEFLRMVSGRNTTHANVLSTVDYSGSIIPIFNDQAPNFWTSFDDSHIVMDSYNEVLDDTLKQSKTQCLAYIFPVWDHTDDFIPDLPAEAFANLIAEAKSTASVQLKQYADQKSEQQSKRQATWLSRKAWSAHGGVRYCDYGRKGRR